MEDDADGLNAMLQIIDAERSEFLYTKSKILRFSSGPIQGQFPECFVNILSSAREAGGGLQETISNIVDVYDVVVSIMLKDFSNDLENIMLNYEEAGKRTLHGKQRNMAGISLISYSSFNRGPVEIRDGNFVETAVLNFKVKIM